MVTHAFAAQIFYRGADAHVLDIRPVTHNAGYPCGWYRGHKSGEWAWVDHHARWAAQMPRDVSRPVDVLSGSLTDDSRMALFAHCVALTANAVRLAV